jgi:hypothetical protein
MNDMLYALKPWLTTATMATLVSLGSIGIAHAQDKANPPPSAQLDYTIRASVQGLSLEGSGTIGWQTAASKYQLSFDTTTALTGKLLSEKSEGSVDRRGLQPASFYSKRFRKEALTVNFDRTAGHIVFPDHHPSLKIEGGEQDRISVLWQLLSLVRATPARFAVGTQWKFFVISHRHGEPWTFLVQEKQKLRTALGEIDTLHLVYQPTDASSAPKVDIWLAPSLDGFPVRIRFSEPNGDAIEQTIAGIKKG